MVNRVIAQENNITKVVIISILVFINCETPAAINQTVYYQLDDIIKYLPPLLALQTISAHFLSPGCH